MTRAIHLLGRPRIVGGAGEVYRFRSRKSWAVLAYLVLSERPPSRSQLAALLFPEADDPVRALRWSLAEVRRALGDAGTVDGDPVVLRLSPGVVVDVDVVTKGAWTDAVRLPGLGADLLDGTAVRGAAAFDTWLLAQQRWIAAAAEAILHEAALGSMSRGRLDDAVGYAVRAAAISPLDENHQALLIRLYRMSGDEDAARRQFDACVATLRAELATEPGAAVLAALQEPRYAPDEIADEPTVRAVVEAGSAAVSAGAVAAGVDSLRTAVRLADRAGTPQLRTGARLILAEALIHTVGGFDEEGLARLCEAEEIALANDLPDAAARARAEFGYVDFLRGRYDRAERWLTSSLAYAEGSLPLRARAMRYLGAVESDRANYPRAAEVLEQAVALAQAARDPRQEAWSRSMLGRLGLFRGSLDTASEQLEASIGLAEREHWLAFLPWPQALLGEVRLARGDLPGATALLEQAFARACQMGDPCWEGISAHGLGLVAEATGDAGQAFTILVDARRRASRLADPYVWLDGYILDALCELGRRHDHPATKVWVEAMRALAARTGMREFGRRSLRHGAALGNEGDAEAAAMLAAVPSDS